MLINAGFKNDFQYCLDVQIENNMGEAVVVFFFVVFFKSSLKIRFV